VPELTTPYIRRHVDPLVDDLMTAFSALMITGPRGCGKTTTAARRATTTLSLDDPRTAEAVENNPHVVLDASPRPLLVDEWQAVPSCLSAIKRIVDRNHTPGQFLITGSVRSRYLTGSWPGTGRFIPVRMWGLTQAELEGHPDLTADWLWHPDALHPHIWNEALDVLDYFDLAMHGGLPDALVHDERGRATWFDGYIDQLIHHDVAVLGDVRTPLALERILQAVALNTTGLPTLSSLAQAAGIAYETAQSYLAALEDMRVIQRLQPWFDNRFTRLAKSPKYYVCDPGLAAHLSHASATTPRTDGGTTGRLMDTFVTAQLRPLMDIAAPRTGMCHLRDTDGRHEVDLMLESSAGIVGLEIKSAAGASARDARHLVWLRDQIPDEFVAGYVLHTGNFTINLSDRVWAVPIAALWRPELVTG